MKVSKRSLMGISAVAGAAILGGAAFYWTPEVATEKEGPAAAGNLAGPKEPANGLPTPLSDNAPNDDEGIVVRGNDPAANDPYRPDDDWQPGARSYGTPVQAAISDEPLADRPPEPPPSQPPSQFATNAYQTASDGSSAYDSDYQPRQLMAPDYSAGAEQTAPYSGAPADSAATDELATSDSYERGTANDASLPSQYGGAGDYVTSSSVSDTGNDNPPPTAPPLQDQYSAPGYPSPAQYGDRATSIERSPAAAPQYLASQVTDTAGRSPTPLGVQHGTESWTPDSNLGIDDRQPQPPLLPGSLGAEATLLAQDTPGSRQLEGVQTPSISVEKVGPEEVHINIPATFDTIVRNVGRVTAHGVTLTDRIPSGTELVGTTPQALQVQGLLIWQLHSLDPDEQQTVSMEVRPVVEGPIGSVAQVSFQTQASAQAVCTRPMLQVTHETPKTVLIGDDVVISITVSNPGTGEATGVVIEEDIPPGLEHPAGGLLESEIGSLQPGESRDLELVVKAASQGMVTNTVRVKARGGLVEVSESTIEVQAPKLLIGMRGPTVRFVERKAKYDLQFVNQGTAPATNVELVAYLPNGLEFGSADHKGQYDPRGHAVFWSLRELPAGETGVVSIEAIPVETGDQIVRAEGQADLGLSDTTEHHTDVKSVTELEFTVADLDDPIEVGSSTTYEIHIVNNGRNSATGIQLAALLPPDLQYIDGEGTTPIRSQQSQNGTGQELHMEQIEELAPGGEAVYRIRVKGQRSGDHVINVQLMSAEVDTPVLKQEGTKVYSDHE